MLLMFSSARPVVNEAPFFPGDRTIAASVFWLVTEIDVPQLGEGTLSGVVPVEDTQITRSFGWVETPLLFRFVLFVKCGTVPETMVCEIA